MEDFSECKSYKEFKKMLKQLDLAYKRYNDGKQAAAGLSECDTEFYRGAVIRVMAIWEAYVYDVLSEGFDVLLKVGVDTWKKTQTAVQNALRRRLKVAGTKDKPWEVIAYNAITEKDALQTLLREHRQHALKNTTPVFGPLSKGTSIDASFLRLFDPPSKDSDAAEGARKKSESKSDCIPGITDQNFEYHTGDVSGSKKVHFDDPKGLHNVSKLYYGLRCVLCHGDPSSTLDEGVLQGFPDGDSLFITKGDDAKGEVEKGIMRLYEDIKKDKRETTVDYITVLNMLQFVEASARLLRKGVVTWIKEHTKTTTPIWISRLSGN